MRIVKLVAENIKKLHVVEITPQGNVITIGGRNGAGKSSVLDTVAYALGGERLVPSEPIRVGESEAKAVVDLGDLVVTRKFKRDYTDDNTLGTRVWGETRSTLVVTNKDGTARYASPQAMLDKILGKLTFDPIAFARAESKDQDSILRKLVGVDVSTLEDTRRVYFAQRALSNKQCEVKAAQLLALPRHDDVPAVEISMEEVSQEMLRAEQLRKHASEAEREVDVLRTNTVALKAKVDRHIDIIKEMERRLQEEREKLKSSSLLVAAEERALATHQDNATRAREAVPDVDIIRTHVSEIEATNVKIRQNVRYAREHEELTSLQRECAALTEEITKVDTKKQALLAAAQFPIAGLGLSDDGITFNGLPFSQAGSAEQLRVSVAIGIALNPTLKVLLIRNGNLLDSASLEAVCKQADISDVQVWIEMVSDTGAGMAVHLADGEVV